MRFSSKSISLVGVFAASHAVLYLISPPGLWRSWSIYLEPLEGIILGPWVGGLAALIGSAIARVINPTDMWMFGVISEPFGVLACGLIAKKRSKPLLVLYAVMLGAYFAHPLGRWLPLWTILDIFAALILIYPASRACRNLFEEDAQRLPFLISLVAFIGIVTDALVRVFLLIPVGLYVVFGWPPEGVYYVFVTEAIKSYVEDLLVVGVSSVIGAPLLMALRKIPGIGYPLS